MAFILRGQRESNVAAAFRRYRDYIHSNQKGFPRSAFDLARSDWYFNPQDHRCPHDAWLKNLSISEPATGNRQEIRATSLRIQLLGAFHDGMIELFYPKVFTYVIDSPVSERGLGDWRYDEFRLSENGRLIHEIEWSGFPDGHESRWLIEASDIEFQWLPQ
jgi:hypothetical protein